MGKLVSRLLLAYPTIPNHSQLFCTTCQERLNKQDLLQHNSRPIAAPPHSCSSAEQPTSGVHLPPPEPAPLAASTPLRSAGRLAAAAAAAVAGPLDVLCFFAALSLCTRQSAAMQIVRRKCALYWLRKWQSQCTVSTELTKSCRWNITSRNG